MESEGSVLITGCSEGGIGFALAKEFQSRGFHVYATARQPARMDALKNLYNVTLLQLDVTSSTSIAAAIAIVTKETGGRLDYLVNNASKGVVLPTLDTDIAQAKAIFEVNVWGALAMTKAFAPLLIAAKGSVVNMGSIAGMMSPPYLGE